MGFGQYASILSGIYASHDICGLGNYEELMKPICHSYENSLVLRRALEKNSDNTLDKVVGSLNGCVGNKLFSDSPFDPLKAASFLLRPYLIVNKNCYFLKDKLFSSKADFSFGKDAGPMP